jgi:uncharacterized membrane protein
MTIHIARVSHVLLLLLALGGLWWQAPEGTPTAAIAVFSLVYAPLVLFLPATLMGDPRLLTWFCFLLMLYFCGFVMQAVEPPPERYLALLRIAVLIALFTSSAMLIRQKGRRA